nr:polysaccharide pyruvyl transferase family protein [Alcanivorax sp. S6407]
MLIYAGALLLLKEHGVKLRLQRSVSDFSLEELRDTVGPNTTILCQGGGNFGDLYHSHQALRESLISAFPDNRIVILPQSVHFESDENLNKCIALFRSHDDVFLFARDERSYQQFKAMSDNVFMAPDTAHYLYRLLGGVAQADRQGVLHFSRTDKEKVAAAYPFEIGEDDTVVDWQDVVTTRDNRLLAWERRLLRLGVKTNSRHIRNLAAYLWQWHVFQVVKRSARFFSRYETVISSRMHGHILACLLDQENMVVDNSYGKNSGYYHAWTKDVDCARLADDAPNANQ